MYYIVNVGLIGGGVQRGIMSQSEDEVKPDLERLKNIFDAANAGVEYAVPYKRVIACVTKTYAILFTPRRC